MKELLLVSIGLLLLSFVIFLGVGFHKLTVYENTYSEDEFDLAEEDESVNAYVGGDAYNYIINASQATAYFVLAGFSLLSAIALGILRVVRELPRVRLEDEVIKE